MLFVKLVSLQIYINAFTRRPGTHRYHIAKKYVDNQISVYKYVDAETMCINLLQ